MADALSQYLHQEVKSGIFTWHDRNCLLFVSRWIDLVRGSSISERWIGAVQTEPQARAYIASVGGAVQLFTEVLGAPAAATEFKRGDVGLLAFDGWHLGITCTGKQWAHCTAKGVAWATIKPTIGWVIQQRAGRSRLASRSHAR